MLLSVHAWILSYWRSGKPFSLYMPGLSHTGGQGNPSLCTYLDSLLAEGTELLLSVRTWTHCWWKRGNSFPLYTLDSLLVEDMEMVLSVHAWSLF